VALPLVPTEPVTLTPADASDIGAAFASWAAAAAGVPPASLTVTVGRDSRLSGPQLAAATAAGVASTGAAVVDFGVATTPAMFMSTVLPFGGRPAPASAAVMLTASHLPPNRNGLKFFTRGGGTSKADVAAILDAAAARRDARGGAPPPVTPAAPVPTHPFLDDYGAHLAGLIRAACGAGATPLAGFHIVVDAGNGAGGFFAAVLAGLGAETRGSQFLNPDGTFPNHVPNPEDAAAMASLVAATTGAGADLGVIFDTDVDRSGVCDRAGGGVNRNRLIAMVARIALRECPGGVIVTDSVTSNGPTRLIEGTGGGGGGGRRGRRGGRGDATHDADKGAGRVPPRLRRADGACGRGGGGDGLRGPPTWCAAAETKEVGAGGRAGAKQPPRKQWTGRASASHAPHTNLREGARQDKNKNKRTEAGPPDDAPHAKTCRAPTTTMSRPPEAPPQAQ